MAPGLMGLQPRADRGPTAGLVPGSALLGSAQRHTRAAMCKARVQELQRLEALQGRTPPHLFLRSQTSENGLPGQTEGSDRWLREKGHWPMMREHLEGHLGHLLLSRKRQDRSWDGLGDRLVSPCSLGEPVGGFIID